MAAAGFMDYLQHGPGVSIARAVQPGWDTVRVLKESLFYRPLAPRPQLLAPLHVDCETGGAGCPEFPVFRLWVTLDPVPRGRGVVFQVELETKVVRMFAKISQSRRRPLTGPSPGRKRRYYEPQDGPFTNSTSRRTPTTTPAPSRSTPS